MKTQKPNTLFRTRLVSLRKSNHLSQKDFAVRLAIFIGRDTAFSPSAVSGWEIGTKEPSLTLLNAIADFFHVTTDYLLGRVPEDFNEKQVFSLNDFIQEITQDELTNYGGQPVFLVFLNSDKIPNQWGIYDEVKDHFCCKQNLIKNNPASMKYYVAPPDSLPSSKIAEYRHTLDSLMESKWFWVEYFAGGRKNAHELYSGWYHHAGDNMYIMNNDGLTLPYSGLGISYYAYRTKI